MLGLHKIRILDYWQDSFSVSILAETLPYYNQHNQYEHNYGFTDVVSSVRMSTYWGSSMSKGWCNCFLVNFFWLLIFSPFRAKLQNLVLLLLSWVQLPLLNYLLLQLILLLFQNLNPYCILGSFLGTLILGLRLRLILTNHSNLLRKFVHQSNV